MGEGGGRQWESIVLFWVKEWIYLTHALEVLGLWQWGREAADHTVSAVRKQRAPRAGVPLVLFEFLFLVNAHNSLSSLVSVRNFGGV